MADVTLPVGIFPVTGAMTGADIMTLLHDPVAPADSLSAINGTLDWNNLATGWVGAHHTQRGSAVQAKQVSRTANLDFMWHNFGDVVTTNGSYTFSAASPIKYLPGGCQTWIQPNGFQNAIVTWKVFFGNDNDETNGDDDYKSLVYLVRNGSAVTAQRRSVGICMSSYTDPLFYKKARVWSGHALISTGSGEQTVGLAFIAYRRICQFMYCACSLRVIPFL